MVTLLVKRSMSPAGPFQKESRFSSQSTRSPTLLLVDASVLLAFAAMFQLRTGW
jgi:hypothetical protein